MSKKQQVMEALLTSNVDLNKEDLMWINSHLPNDDGNGEHLKQQWSFNHEEKDLFKSIGVDDKIAMKVANVFAEATKNLMIRDDYAMSNAVEEILTNASDIPQFEALIVSKLLRDSVDKIEESTGIGGQLPKALIQILREMRKRDKNED